MSSDEIEPFLTTKDASDYLGGFGVHLAPDTLIKLRCVGGGPAFFKLGRNVGYTRSKLRDFVRAKAKPMIATTVPAQVAA